MDEFDQLGRDDFLTKYGFGPSRSYFVQRSGKLYDSKAIVGAAHGYQHPAVGPLRPEDFSGGDGTVRPLLEKLGFAAGEGKSEEHYGITAVDLALFAQSRSRNRYSDFSDDEKAAYRRVHNALGHLGQVALSELGGSRDYVLKLTSGFHPASGVRGAKPKDLWFGVYRRENETSYVGNPQLFMIMSERGLEYGFAPLTHPDDFSNQEIKKRVREIARPVLGQMPAPGSPEAIELADDLSQSGSWYFRRKQRLVPNQSEYETLDSWLAFVRSDEGTRNAGGGITRYVLPEQLDQIQLDDEVRLMARIFRPLMERIVANAPPTIATEAELQPEKIEPSVEVTHPAFADLLRAFLREFSIARGGPFQKTEPLWTIMSDLKARLEQFPAIKSRPNLMVTLSVGQGNWATVPWIALLNSSVTRSTQEGMYVVFLIAKELNRAFLTLNQGTTNLVRQLGQTEAQRQMLDVAAKTRLMLADLQGAGFNLDNKIALGGGGWLAKNHEIGTIAHVDFEADSIPQDDRMNELLETVLDAYDRAIDEPAAERQPDVAENAAPLTVEAYTMDDALADVFIEQATLERLLAIWKAKKNLILQGAPGVGKSFVAKRLAYLLVGAKDPGRVETVQFHQSYSYEDFVQGYRPDGKGSFLLRDGVFYRFCEKAKLSPSRAHVFIVDEINRGNLSKILGELMLLIEHDKRGPAWATSLTYSKPDEPRFFVPENLYILGMMNTADRSLSMVDYALRRRFSFAPLEPMFGSDRFAQFLRDRGVPDETVELIVTRMTALNNAIAEDRANLGPGFRIGHSFFVPNDRFEYDPGWYRRVIETEILPLLDEYWFDDADEANGWGEKLLQSAP
ncbi:DUF3578 domain-containing protein [Mesorhizobium australicum]|uniref:MrcB family domain-containing protein n=1 Tax=Mesorhizobium australicum TaxID=536018 RepID=UPI00333B7AD2